MSADPQTLPRIRSGFHRSLWLTTLRPLEDVAAAPRDRLEAYFELLDFICDVQFDDAQFDEDRFDDVHFDHAQPDPVLHHLSDASGSDNELPGVPALMTYTRALLSRLVMHGASVTPPNLPDVVDAVMASGLAVTARGHGSAPAAHIHQRLQAARRLALQPQ